MDGLIFQVFKEIGGQTDTSFHVPIRLSEDRHKDRRSGIPRVGLQNAGQTEIRSPRGEKRTLDEEWLKFHVEGQRTLTDDVTQRNSSLTMMQGLSNKFITISQQQADGDKRRLKRSYSVSLTHTSDCFLPR